MTFAADICVIVPIGPEDAAWQTLVLDLQQLPSDVEIIFAATAEPGEAGAKCLSELTTTHSSVRWATFPRGRAAQLNSGAQLASRPWLWFLHADTRIPAQALDALARSVAAAPEALHYFNLRFAGDGPKLMVLNEVGVQFRSRVLKMPFGDQGFCLRKDTLERLGGFPLHVPYGEDHRLIWLARQNGIEIKCCGGWLVTSARKYQERGWLAVTLTHLLLTWRQAYPEWRRLRREEGAASTTPRR